MRLLFGHLQRSGGHAVIDFIIDNLRYDGNVIFHNNVNIATYVASQIFYYGEPPYKHLIFSVENVTSCDLQNIELDVSCKIIVLRTFQNFMASLWNYRILNFPFFSKDEFVEIWKDNVDLYLNNPKQNIFFDSFISNKKYRQFICSQLGIEIRTEESLNKMSLYGGGSSFGDIDNVLNRYKQVQDPEYVNFVARHHDLVELSDKIQNDIERQFC